MSSKASPPSAAIVSPPGQWHEHDRGGHLVQFYMDDAYLVTALGRHIGAALGAGDAAVVIATKTHRDGIEQRLAERGLDLAEARRRHRYIPLDAAETLTLFMRGGRPDAALFNRHIGEAILRAERGAGKDGRVAAFGEMVSLLWEEGKTEAALEVERLWNKLAGAHSFSLLCTYRMGGFIKEEDASFLKVCEEHTGVLPGESYAAQGTEAEKLRNIALMQQRQIALEAKLALAQTEQLYQLFVQSVVDYAIFILDPGGYVSTWNSGAERIKGYSAEDIIGKHFSVFYLEEDLRAGKPRMELEAASREGRFEDRGGWRVRKDGSRFWANVVITALRDKDGVLRGFSKVTRDITAIKETQDALERSNEGLRKEVAERRAAEEKLRVSQRNLRQLSAHLLRTQDEERRHLGRELHDSIGQYLATLKMGLDTLKSEAREEDLARRLRECVELADQAIAEVRTMSYLLYPPMLEEMGLYTAISWYLDGLAKRSGIRTAVQIPPSLGRLPREAELAIFRVLQESVANVHRHSGSQTAQVRLMVKDGEARIEVKDQGKGIPSSVLESIWEGRGTLGVGLRGMSERLQQIGGRLEIGTSEKGTTVCAIVPFDGSALREDVPQS